MDTWLSHSPCTAFWVFHFRRVDQPVYGFERMDIQPATITRIIVSTGGLKLDSWRSDIGRDDSDGADGWAHGFEGDCGWSTLGHPELCDQCISALGDDSCWDIFNDDICFLGISNNNKSMENEEVMMADLLGTAWWSVICVMIGIGFGIYIYPWLKNRLGR